jgi:integrase
MREGELLGLKWADVDLEAGALRARRTLTRHGDKVALGETKKSRRTVRLTPRAVEALKRHRARQAGEKLKAGSLYGDRGLVFSGEGGGSSTRPTCGRGRSCRSYRGRSCPGSPSTTSAAPAASLLFQRNVHPKFVQELLGHASIVITLDTYSHMLPSMGGKAADAMGEALG